MSKFFSAGNTINQEASDMECNGLRSKSNIETLMIWIITKRVAPPHVKAVMSKSGQKKKLDEMIDKYREDLAPFLHENNLGCLAAHPVDSWKEEKETGTYSSFDRVPYDGAIRIRVMPLNVVISCVPESLERLEKFLRRAAFVKHIEEIVHNVVDEEGITSHQHVVDDRELSLRDFLTEFKQDVVDQIGNFLTETF
jgi:hypothetical protein